MSDNPVEPSVEVKAETRTQEDLEALLGFSLKGIDAKIESVLGQVTVTVPREDIHSACRIAKDNDQLAFDYLACLSAVDYPANFQVVYHLYSTKRHHRAVFKTNVPKEDPVLPSVLPVWRGADWHEREAAEMFGLAFSGHPNLRHLLLPDDFEDHPLLKSYKLPEEKENGGRS